MCAFSCAALPLTGCAARERPDQSASEPVGAPSAIAAAPTGRHEANRTAKSPVPAIAASEPAAATSGSGYPPPPPAATPTRDPSLWYPGELEAAIESALPADAVVYQRSKEYWHTHDGGLPDLYGVRYTVDGQPNVAAVTVRPSKLLWDLRRDGPPELEPLDSWPINVAGSGPGVVVTTASTSWLLLLTFDGEPRALAQLPLPADTEPGPLREYTGWPAYRERDLTGDAVPDPVLYFDADRDTEPVLALYQRLPDGSARLVHTAGRGSVLHDYDRDGLLDVITLSKSGSWDLWRWQGDAFGPTDTLTAPAAPAPQPLLANALPPLPANLTFHGRSRTVLRWPRAGGPLQTLWRAEDGAAGLRGFRVSADGSHVLYALEEPGESAARPVTLALQDVNTGTLVSLPTHGELRDYEVSADGQRVVYMGIGAGPDGGLLPRPPSGGGLSGTLFAVDAADPTHFTAVGNCLADPDEWWATDCGGEVALAGDASQVAYADGRYLWVAALPDGTPRQLLEHYKSKQNETGARIYGPDRWMPDGRGLLVNVGGWEGSHTAIVDTASGELTDIPDTGVYSSPLTQLAFFADTDAMFLTRWLGDAPLRIVDAAAPETVVSLWDTLAIAPEVQYHAIGAAAATDGGLLFALRHWEAGVWRGNGVFRADRDGTGLAMLAALPPPDDDPEEDWYDPGALTWSSDGAAFLMRYVASGGQRALVGLADGSGLWDASELLGAADWAAWSQ